MPTATVLMRYAEGNENSPIVTDTTITPTANALQLLQISTNDSVTPSTVTAVTGCGLTWVEVANLLYDDVGVRRGRLQLFRAMSAAPTAGVLSITFTGQISNEEFAAQWVEITGVSTGGTNGSGAIVQSVTASGTSTTPSATLAPLATAANPSYGIFALNTNGFPADNDDAFTAASGYEEIGEWGYRKEDGTTVANWYIAGATEWKKIGSTTVNGTYYASNTWGAIALELDGTDTAGAGALATLASDVPYLTSNDRYEIALCADRGTSTTDPEFRHWYAGPPLWGEAVAGDASYPTQYTLDENSLYTPGSLELPFQDFKGKEATIQGVYVEFNTRPSSISESIASTYPIGFTASVQGYGVPNYSRTTTNSLTTGVHTSTTVTYTASAGYQADEPWPNTRGAFLPIRMDQRVKKARVTLTDIHLVEIVNVQLIGDIHPPRTA